MVEHFLLRSSLEVDKWELVLDYGITGHGVLCGTCPYQKYPSNKTTSPRLTVYVALLTIISPQIYPSTM
jgi:hypothetical protein